jgi:plastocyanin
MRRTVATAVLLATAVTLPLAACGDDDDDATTDTTSAATAGAVHVVAEDSLTFDEDSYSADAGEVSFVYENGGALPHTLVIDGIDTDDFKLSVGDTDEGSVELEPGEYTIFCDVPGHRGAGMEATLTVS